MNEGHLQILGSDEWAEHLAQELLPWVLSVAPLGDDVLEVGPGPGRTTDLLRERAERDLEFDPAFRNAVIRLADEMRLFERGEAGGDATERWKLVARRIAELPQMRPAGGDRHPAPRATINPLDRRPVGMGMHILPGRRAVFVMLGLVAAFALGYLAGKL